MGVGLNTFLNRYIEGQSKDMEIQPTVFDWSDVSFTKSSQTRRLIVTSLLTLKCVVFWIATWHQYDGVSYIYEKNFFETIKGWFRSEETAGNRAAALLVFLPKWKGFVVDDAGREMSATNAILRADEVINCMINVFIKSSHPKAETKKPPNFNVHQVKPSRTGNG